MLLFYYTTTWAPENLKHERIKSSKGAELNDPFELSPTFDPADYTAAHFRAFLLRPDVIEGRHREENPLMPFHDYKRWYRKTIGQRVAAKYRHVDNQLRNAQSHFVSIFDAAFRMICFSKRHDSILMWSHYARNHTGVAVGVDSTRPPLSTVGGSGSTALIEVRYKNEKAKFEYNPGNPGPELYESVYAIAGRKSPEWEYEEEVRLLYPITLDGHFEEPHFIHFPPNTITIVVFGCRTPEAERAKITALLSEKRYSHVAIYEAIKSEGEFKLDFNPIRKSDRASL